MPKYHAKTHIERLFENAVNLNISKQLTSGSMTTYSHYAMRHAYDHIQTNMDMLCAGVSLRDLTMNGHKLDRQFRKLKYGCMMHGVGLCDEWPLVAYPDQYVEGAFDYALEARMVLCVEALVSPEGGDFSIKLEDQVLITETGHENLTAYPFDSLLMGEA